VRLFSLPGGPRVPDAERLLRECVRDYKPPLTESRIRNLLRYARSPGHSLLLYSGKDLVAMAAFRRYRTRDFSYYGYPRARGLAGFGQGSWFAPGFAVEDDSVGPVTQAIEGCRTQQLVRKRCTPFVKVQVARREGRGSLVTLGNEFVEVFILGGAHGA